MIVLIVGLVVILVVAVMLRLWWSAGTGGAAAVDPRVAVDLHAIRRRRDLAEFKTTVRRDVVRAQRELRAELEAERGQSNVR